MRLSDTFRNVTLLLALVGLAVGPIGCEQSSSTPPKPPSSTASPKVSPGPEQSGSEALEPDNQPTDPTP